jgi:PAS domain S-box-containing protein
MLKFVPKKYWPKLLRSTAKLSQGNVVEGEIEIITPKGKIISEYRSNPIRRGKKVVGFQAILRNITERKAMDEKLKQYSERLEALVQKRTKELSESQKNYSVLVEEANVGVATLQDGKIVFVNKKGEEIIGCSRDELIGLPFMKLVSEEYRQIVMERYAQRIKGESVPPTYEIEVNAKNGEHIPIEISAAHISYQGRPADLILVRDIREKKRMEEQRSKLERLASIGELAAMVGHDLRNPLTGIMGAAYYLKTKHGTEVGAKGKEMLETIEKAINYSNKIINDLLEYSRDLKLELTATTPKAILQSALPLLEVQEKIQIIDATKDKPMVKADTEKIRTVFVNIIQNAIDAMPEGGTLTIKSRKVKDKLEIAFKDTGTGMSEETLSKLKGGVPLFTTKAKGMGFGLPICRRLAEAHGGKLSVKSKAGKGTTVTVTIPVNPEPVDEGEEKWIFSESMLSAITSAQRAP